MNNFIKKHQIIFLILGLISIGIGITIFTIVIKDYNDNKKFINNAQEVEGYVYNVKAEGHNKYSFEYKYRVNNVDYRNFINKMPFKKSLKENDSITIYYDKKNVKNNVVKKPSKKSIYIAISFLTVFCIIGIFNIIKFFKK